MRFRRTLQAATGWQSVLVASTLFHSVLGDGDKNGPKMTSTKLDHRPATLRYFDDSDVIMYQDDFTYDIWRSPDAGETWKKINGPEPGSEYNMQMHPFDNKRAYVMTEKSTHWMTDDRGETWKEFFTDATPKPWTPALSFHAGDPDRIIFNGEDCSSLLCEEISMYTTSGFRDDTKFLKEGTGACYWAKSTELFTTGQEDLDKTRILCISKGKYSWFPSDYRLLISDNFFTSNGDDVQEFEPELEAGRVVSGISDMAIVKGYLVAAAKADESDEMSLYVSDDTIKWHKAVFPADHRLDQNAYTILESTNYSIQIDVMTTRNINPMGTLFSSNSNGTYYTRLAEHTNRDVFGLVDFEKMAGIQGIMLINTVGNAKEVEDHAFENKEIVSQISFDDGRNWQDMKVKDKTLHLHSVTDMENIGRIFSSPAPGIMLGVGNTGKSLKEYNEGDTYVSDDAGETWRHALDGPYKYEIGDSGSILVAVREGKTDALKFSLNHGQDWTSVGLPEEMIPYILTTTADSSSLKFVLVGTVEHEAEKSDFRFVSIDFAGMHERTCEDKDFEKWYARADGKGEGTCIMGHKQFYNRRKADADCFVKQEFKNPVPEFEYCECTDEDFECDFNFVRNPDRTECVRAGNLVLPEGACKGFDASTTFKGSSGWRLIPGNACKRQDGPQKDDLVDRKCIDAIGNPADGKLKHTSSDFSGASFLEKVYLEREGYDEAIITRTSRNEVYLSKDAGRSWERILKGENIEAIIPHPYFKDVVYFLDDSTTVHYSVDRGDNIRQFNGPEKDLPDAAFKVMDFHPKHKDWIIWTGVRDCDGGRKTSGDCHGVSSITKDRGDNWETLQRYVRKCEFIKDAPPQRRDENLIYCDVRTRESMSNDDNPYRLVASSDSFQTEPEVHFDDIIGFATMSEFIVVAAKDEQHNLRVDASVDGSTFAEAQFPSNFQVPHQSAYTVMDSSTHSVFLHVTVENREGSEYGSIIKSNSNGTSYVLSLVGVNRDIDGYVDFEKMTGLEGVALVNIVDNYNTVTEDNRKNLKTVMTHNDGAEWSYIAPPSKDAKGEAYSCSGSPDQCSLHIHGYTERRDKSKTYSSPTAIGMMIGVGNVGAELGPYSEADTFITADAGITWKAAQKGTYMWQYGDQGSIIVLARDRQPTRSIFYSRNEGDSWEEYTFSDEEVDVVDLTTASNDNSKNFVVWCDRGDGDLKSINIDFSGLTDRQCKLDENGENEDYYLWTPKHPKQDDDCLFGHVAQYHRKKTSADCYNGLKITHLHNIAQNCQCTRRDFECDYNYEPQSDGTCALVSGYQPPDHSAVCDTDPDTDEYFEPTGYRRIPLTTCQGGRELEYVGQPKPCKGKEDKFNQKHGISAIGLFFAISLPILAAAGIGYYVWENWSSNFGQIRLGEQSSFDGEAAYIRYPVMVLSAVVAVALTLPSLLSSAWKEVSRLIGRTRQMRYTTRRSFARESDYAAVDEDDGELLGDDSDEEV